MHGNRGHGEVQMVATGGLPAHSRVRMRNAGHGARHRSQQPVRLTRRGRICARALAGVLVTAVILLGEGVRSGAMDVDPAIGSGLAAGPSVVVVEEGDTLWGIAVRVAPKVDPREAVDILMERNDLSSPLLRVGQRLRLS